ncbi:DUF1501 domain-containing protein [Nocardioides sp.]|uniref:DUF1501 domain-containing protein n=1 Tax=Nocardioides sp. TaxID=35761 RepID=UPI002B26FF00|nr:DUF1501 domain-containing protein [Nocardioides sp.]
MIKRTAPRRAAQAACCPEYAGVSRRGLLSGGLAVGTTAVLGSAVVTAAPASAAAAGAVMVVLSLRGAADGLSLVVPYNDPVIKNGSARPKIGIPAGRLLATNGTFGLHPELAPVLPLWNAGEMAAVHATGLPAPNRSHFAAMEEIEDANPGSTTREGWLNRLIGDLPGTSPLQGFAVGGGVVPTSLYGTHPVMSAGDVESVGFAGVDGDDGSRLRSLHTLWDRKGGPLGSAMSATFGSVRDFAPARDTSDGKSSYPNTDLGRALSEVARIIRGDVGVGVITVDQGDWDMHSGLGTLDWGSMRNNARELAEALAAFFDDLGNQRSKVTLVAFSEFGRRVQENANYGLDHGYGNVMLLAGAGVKGGYYGTMPPLSAALDADVPVTTDYRSVLSEVVTTRLKASRAAVFPGFSPEPVGVMTSL